MADVFISYAHEDIERARELAAALEASGVTAWWDRSIPAGGTFDDMIENALAAASNVIVLWSTASVTSQWVRNEATDANERLILVPALIERDVRIPLAFRRVQAADLTDWHGDLSDPAFADFVAVLRRRMSQVVQRVEPTVAAQPSSSSPISPRRLATVLPWAVLSFGWAYVVRDGSVASPWLVAAALVSASVITILIDRHVNVWVVAAYGLVTWPVAFICLIVFFNNDTIISLVWRPIRNEAAQDMVVSVAAAVAAALVLSRPLCVDQFDPRAVFRGFRSAVRRTASSNQRERTKRASVSNP